MTHPLITIFIRTEDKTTNAQLLHSEEEVIQGRLLLSGMPTLLATIGWLATLTEDGCNYAIIEGAIVTEMTTNPDMPFLEVGLNRYREASLNDDGTWAIDYYQLCKYYNEDIVNIDGVWKFSKVMSFLALNSLFGIISCAHSTKSSPSQTGTRTTSATVETKASTLLRQLSTTELYIYTYLQRRGCVARAGPQPSNDRDLTKWTQVLIPTNVGCSKIAIRDRNDTKKLKLAFHFFISSFKFKQLPLAEAKGGRL
eukprot:scaffold21263_cov122-Skeletonema_dohrnii-CCMP3373.AAC.2